MKTEVPPSELITRQQVAQRLSVHPQTIKRMHRKPDGGGKLTPYILGANLVRYSCAEVEALIGSAKVSHDHQAA